jgi:undecaprenyl diphosphate synthase
MENWKRPLNEVSFLMQMYIDYLRQERETMRENDIRYNQIGRTDGLPEPVLDEMHRTLEETRNNNGLVLTLALNYGSRAEIVDGVRAIADRVRRGELDPRDITEQTISDALYTRGMPDPDLLIRTAGEMRVSNYLLWQISYAELVVSPVLWPDFGVKDLHAAFAEFAGRNRRFGGLDRTNGGAT